MGISLADMKAKLTITAGVTGAELIDKFGGKLNTVGKTADQVNKQMSSLDRTVRGLAAGFSAAGLASFIAEAARVNIQLDAFDKQLSVGFGQFHTLELEKLRNTMRELGVAQDEALGSAVRFTSALKLSGQSMLDANTAFENATKLILSNKLTADGANRVYYAMAQIASKGKLMSEELNGQLGDVLAGFTQQVAASMDMSTAQLAKAMEKGEVSSDKFFTALNKIGGAIDPAQLESAARSLANLKNEWFDFKDALLDSSTVKQSLDAATTAIRFLTDNGSTLASLFGIGLATAIGAYTSKTAASTLATVAQSNAVRAAALAAVEEAAAERAATVQKLNAARVTLELARANAVLGTSAGVAAAEVVAAANAVAVASGRLAAAEQAALAAGAGTTVFGRAASGLSAILGGPVGIALTAITVGVYTYSSAIEASEARQLALAQTAKEMGMALSAASQMALRAAGETVGVGNAAAGAEPKAWAFRNATDNLTKSLWEQAKAARAARLELLDQKLAKVQNIRDEAQGATWGGSRDLTRRSNEALLGGDILKSMDLGWKSVKSDFAYVLSGGRTGREAQGQVGEADRIIANLKKERDALVGQPIGAADVPQSTARTAPATAGSGSKKTGGSKKATGPTPVQIEKSYQDMLNGITQADINARQALSQNTAERFQFERDALASEISEKRASLAAAKNFTAHQQRMVGNAIDQLEADKKRLIEAQAADAAARERSQLEQVDLEGKQTMLQLQLELTTDSKSRKAIQRQLLDLETQLERTKLEEIVAAKTSTDAEKEIARRKLAQLEQQAEAKAAVLDRQQQGPLGQWKDQMKADVGDMNEALEGVAVKGLGAVQDGLMEVLEGTKSVGEAFKDMARLIIQELLKIAIQKFITQSIGGLFADGGAFSGGHKLFANGGAFMGGVEYFANGGVVTRPTGFGMAGGKMGVMGEAGPEAIMPLKRMSNGKLGIHSAGGGGGNVENNVSVSVNVDGSGGSVSASNGQAAQLGKAISAAVQQELVKQQRPGGLLAQR